SGAVLATKPQITMDDGADLVTELHTKRRELLPDVRGGTEETTTGVTRLRAMAAEGVLAYPIVAVNDALTKHLFDNRYGTGQSAVDGILRATNLLLAGKIAVVAGYGWVGRGIASRLRGMGSIVLVCEVAPLRALEAAMDMSFANQALSVEYLVARGRTLKREVYPVPRELDEDIARRKLAAMNMKIDSLTAEQAEYAKSWKAGT